MRPEHRSREHVLIFRHSVWDAAEINFATALNVNLNPNPSQSLSERETESGKASSENGIGEGNAAAD